MTQKRDDAIDGLPGAPSRLPSGESEPALSIVSEALFEPREVGCQSAKVILADLLEIAANLCKAPTRPSA